MANNPYTQLRAAQALYEAGLSTLSRVHYQRAAQLQNATQRDSDPVLLRMQNPYWPATPHQFDQDRAYLQRCLNTAPVVLPLRQIRHGMIQGVGFVVTVLILLVGSAWVERDFLARYVDSEYQKTASQSHYLQPAPDYFGNRVPLHWAEFGKDGAWIHNKIDFPALNIELQNFAIGEPWLERRISWSIQTAGGGVITVKFPPGSVTDILIFMSDGDSYWRMGVIQLGDYYVAASDLYNGRWYALPLTDAQVAAGQVEIQVHRLSGANMAVSALAAFKVGD